MAFRQERCASGKRVYVREDLAEDALIEAWVHFDFSAGKGPVGVYRCEDCGNYHLTSSGAMNDKLDKALRDGTIGKLREAFKWERKFRHR